MDDTDCDAIHEPDATCGNCPPEPPDLGDDSISADLELENPVFTYNDDAFQADVPPLILPDLLMTLAERLLEAAAQIMGTDNDEPEYEPGHHQVDWDRLHRLRQAHAIESEDLFEWYAQQE